MRNQLLVFVIILLCSCQSVKQEMTLSGLHADNFKKEINGQQTALYLLTNKNGMEVCITNFGARIVSIMVPDKNGDMKDVVLGFDSIQDYITYPTDFGATIGRYANRIKNGRFTCSGQEIQLPQNNFGHCLHGGPNGWQYKIFNVRPIDDTSLEMTVFSPDGDENFPGNVEATVRFFLRDDNAIDIQYEAQTDKTTIINMTNHSYFNLSGNPTNNITDHYLYINANAFTPVDSTFMTTGEIRLVSGTPMDFTNSKPIAKDINMNDEQIKNGNGFDHNWVLNTKGELSQVAAKAVSPVSGIVLEVFTNEPGIQLYTGNFLDGTLKGKKEICYQQRAAFCLETQHYPDSPNKPNWPSVVLNSGEKYISRCIYKFSVQQ